jgi:gamma-glutamylcyclotransferase (GGCT)/AIG2-like uncharacterized protein YtfP
MTMLPFFVYGTLKRGESNYAPFLAGRTTSEQPATLPGAALYSEGAYPYMVVAADLVEPSDDSVQGMVMTVDAAEYASLLPQIDMLEDYIPGDPLNEYERVVCTVQTPAGPLEAWAYVAAPRVLEAIRRGGFRKLAGGVWNGSGE